MSDAKSLNDENYGFWKSKEEFQSQKLCMYESFFMLIADENTTNSFKDFLSHQEQVNKSSIEETSFKNTIAHMKESLDEYAKIRAVVKANQENPLSEKDLIDKANEFFDDE